MQKTLVLMNNKTFYQECSCCTTFKTINLTYQIDNELPFHFEYCDHDDGGYWNGSMAFIYNRIINELGFNILLSTSIINQELSTDMSYFNSLSYALPNLKPNAVNIHLHIVYKQITDSVHTTDFTYEVIYQAEFSIFNNTYPILNLEQDLVNQDSSDIHMEKILLYILNIIANVQYTNDFFEFID